MLQDRRNRVPPKLPVLFLLLAGVPLVAISWMGWQLLERDRALEAQRERGRVEAAATALGREVQRILRGWDDAASAAAAGEDVAVPAHGTLLTFDRRGLLRVRGEPVPYVPVAPVPVAIPEGTFEAAERLEFRERDLQRAVRAYGQLVGSPHPAVRAEALMRLARCYRKLDQRERALQTYELLAASGATLVAGSPAELVARRERVALLGSDGPRSEWLREKEALDAALMDGRFHVDRATFDFFHEGRADASLPPERAARAQAAIALWSRWTSDPGGRATWSGDRDTYAAAWQTRAGTTAALVVPAATLLDQLASVGSTLGVDVVPLDASPDLRLEPGPGGSVDPLAPAAAIDAGGLLSLQAVSHSSAASWELLTARRRLTLAAIAVMGLVMGLAGYTVFRAVHREIAIARLQSDFLAAVSHEFRTPLTAMAHLTEMLDEGHARPDRVPRYYKALATETRRLHGLVERLLDFAGAEAGSRRYAMSPLAISPLVIDVINDLRLTHDLSDARVTLSTPPEAAAVRGDRDALALALRNLIDNAIKYSPVTSTVRVSVQTEARTVAVAVDDDGPGMSRGEQRAVFRRFVRGGAARAMNVKGTGIGLTMARQVVAAHGGHISLSSTIGCGTTFVVTLPRLH